MAPKEPSISTLKFVGTVSLGLLTGLSYTISTVSVPSLLAIPTAGGASRALSSLATSSRTHLRSLTAIASTAFLTAYAISPRHLRHPYLLYVGILTLSSTLSRSITPHIPASVFSPFISSTAPFPKSSSAGGPILTPLGSSSVTSSSRGQNRMEQSYEVLGDATSDDAATSGGEEDTTPAASTVLINGEEVRGEIEEFQRQNVVQTAVAGLGFMMAVLGLWGDGVANFVNARETIVFEF
jgi:autophagy-related protein 33